MFSRERLDELLELINRMADDVPPPDDPVKLTAWQRDELVRLCPPDRSVYAQVGQIGELTGRRIELVDREEDSDFPLWRPVGCGFHADLVIIDEPVEPVGPADFIRRAERDGRIRANRDGVLRIRPEHEPRRGWLGRWLDRVFGGQA